MAQAEICPRDLTQQVLVIQLPRGDRGEADLTAYRDYVVASLAQGVLVLGSRDHLGGGGASRLGRGADPSGTLASLRAHSVPGGPSRSLSRHGQTRGGRRRETLERLQQYRQAGGLGCLEAVSSQCGGDLTADKLRGVLTGAEKLPIEQWRLIRRALDQLEGGRR